MISVRLMEYTQRDCVAGHTMGDNSTSSGMTDGERGKGVGKPLANVLADFVCGLQFCSLPSAAVQVAMNGIIDCIGVTVAGSHEQPVQILRRGLAASAPQGEATILGSKGGMRTSAAEAAWINGTAGHVLDYDDVARGHPSVVIVPAVLAEAEALDAGGTDILTAYVAGYEVWMELMLRERGSYQMKGLHHTPIIGALAAAAACAKLRHLSAKQTMHALGIAAAQASGIVASHGTMAKSFQVGRAAHAGVLSARLADLGMTASPYVLDDERGFLKAISPEGDVDIVTIPDRLGVDWHICDQGLSFKRYPVCYATHRTIDATLGLVEQRPIAVDKIEKIEAMLSDIHATVLVNHLPQSCLEAKFSVEFAVASALVAGNVGLQQVNDEFVCRGDVQKLMGKVRVLTNQNYDPDLAWGSVHDQVRIYLHGGTMLESEKIRYARGNSRLPLARDDLKRKFVDCVAFGNSDMDGAALFDRLQQLESLPNCHLLSEAHHPNPVI